MAKLTDKDYEILDFIYKGIKKNGYPPTVREIGAAVNFVRIVLNCKKICRYN